ncbi:class I SAM-dependent methyltransferase [Magnetospira sp. QH-2]|uniref:class I SAM-dependent methyltransferase n=1 Tax=Magnetospira sp. (strain QH-2) TaxID=1288970 RepID=UPI0011DCD1D7|nr:class I SAM-dependent methyltransferase [Magnetospira sp. QH-2]
MVEAHYGLRELQSQPDPKSDNLPKSLETSFEAISGGTGESTLVGGSGNDTLGLLDGVEAQVVGDEGLQLGDAAYVPNQNPDGSFADERQEDGQTPQSNDDNFDPGDGHANHMQARENDPSFSSEETGPRWWENAKSAVANWVDRLDPNHPDNPHNGIPDHYLKIQNPTKHQLVKDIVFAKDADVPGLRQRIEKAFQDDPDTTRRDMALGLLEQRGDKEAVSAYLNGAEGDTNRWNQLTRDDPTPVEMAAMGFGGVTGRYPGRFKSYRLGRGGQSGNDNPVVIDLMGGKQSQKTGSYNVDKKLNHHLDARGEKVTFGDRKKDRTDLIGPAKNTSVPNGSADTALAISPQANYLGEAARILKPGGKLIIGASINKNGKLANKYGRVPDDKTLASLGLRVVSKGSNTRPDEVPKGYVSRREDNNSVIEAEVMRWTVLEKID